MTGVQTVQKKYLTKEGWEKMKKEHQQLTTVGRKAAAQRIQKAREDGEVEENLEYQAALEEKDLLEARVLEIEEVLRHAEVVEKRGRGLVTIGTKVRVRVDGEVLELVIVGSEEADPERGHISYESLVGQALLKAKVGDFVEIPAPTKTVYKIIAIE